MITFLIFLPALLLFVIIAVYAERKIAASIQDRIGPLHVGPYGLLQTVADLLKMLQKEDIVPKNAIKTVFLGAPLIIFLGVFMGYAVLPISKDLRGSNLDVGVLFLFAVVTFDVLGILLAGWASNNKYSLMGAIRSAAQLLSYEIPLTLSVFAVLILSGTFDLYEISLQQGIYGNNHSGFLGWYIFRNPFLFIAFIIFFISGLAESNRAPFDLPEAESELIGGYHTEYSGFRWGIFMLAEYGMMLLIALLGVILFFGGWNTPLPNIGNTALATFTSGHVLWDIFWLSSKTLIWVFVQMWTRWTLPRLRMDQLTSFSWKFLTPLAMIVILLVAGWQILVS